MEHGLLSLASDGTHWYKFLVGDDDWYPDPLNQDRSPDGHGGQNTVLRLGAEANLDPSLARIQADGSRRIRFRTLRDDVQSVSLIRPDSNPVELHPLLTDDNFQWWEAIVSNSNTNSPYTFIVQDASTERYPDIHTMTESEQSPFVTPDWARDAICTRSWSTDSEAAPPRTTPIKPAPGIQPV